MGMDVYGKKPTSKIGEYFRQSVWGWRPLADYVEVAAPSIASKCKGWHTNDGFGLNAEDAKTLAEVLQIQIDNGTTAAYVAKYKRHLDNLAPEPCKFCEDGITTANQYPAYQVHVGKTCIQCKGKGFRESILTWYSLSVDTIQEFVNFMRDSGGFEIH